MSICETSLDKVLFLTVVEWNIILQLAIFWNLIFYCTVKSCLFYVFIFDFCTTADEEFDELCFQFGIEVDDIIDDPEKGITLKIEVGANRYDLLCLEGISRALNIFLGNVQIPNYQLVPPKLPKEYRIIVKPNTAKVNLITTVHLFIFRWYWKASFLN